VAVPGPVPLSESDLQEAIPNARIKRNRDERKSDFII
jgi:hypothetical protein